MIPSTSAVAIHVKATLPSLLYTPIFVTYFVFSKYTKIMAFIKYIKSILVTYDGVLIITVNKLNHI